MGDALVVVGGGFGGLDAGVGLGAGIGFGVVLLLLVLLLLLLLSAPGSCFIFQVSVVPQLVAMVCRWGRGRGLQEGTQGGEAGFSTAEARVCVCGRL